MGDQPLNGMAAGFCGQLKSFVTCLHSNAAQLKASVSRKPPAYGDLSSFLLDFNDRAAEDGAQMDLLEEMIEDNVSFEELLAHCMELYNQIESSTALLESHLGQFGYAKGESVRVGEERQSSEVSLVYDLKQRVKSKELDSRGSTDSREDILAVQCGKVLHSSSFSERSYAQFETIRSSTPRGIVQSHPGVLHSPSPSPSAVANSKLDSDYLSMLGESFSLEDFGLSASALASLPRIDPMMSGKSDIPAMQKKVSGIETPSENGSDMDESCGSSPGASPPHKASGQPVCPVTDEEYAQLLPWLKLQIPLKELNEIVVKINDAFYKVGGGMVDKKPLELEDSLLFDLGPTMKICLVMLVQIKRLEVTSHNGHSVYHPCSC